MRHGAACDVVCAIILRQRSTLGTQPPSSSHLLAGRVVSLERAPKVSSKMGNKGVKHHKSAKENSKFNEKEMKQICAVFNKICGRRSSATTDSDTEREFDEEHLKASVTRRSAPLTLLKMEGAEK